MYRILQYFKLEGTNKDQSVTPCSLQDYWALNPCTESMVQMLCELSHLELCPSPGSLFLCLSPLWGKDLSLSSSLTAQLLFCVLFVDIYTIKAIKIVPAQLM